MVQKQLEQESLLLLKKDKILNYKTSNNVYLTNVNEWFKRTKMVQCQVVLVEPKTNDK